MNFFGHYPLFIVLHNVLTILWKIPELQCVNKPTSQYSRPSAFITTGNMHMGAAVGALKYAGYQYIAQAEGRSADRAISLQLSVNTVSAAANVH